MKATYFRSILVATLAAAGAAALAASPTMEEATPSSAALAENLAAGLQAVQDAQTTSQAVEAFVRTQPLNPTDVPLHAAFVRKMVELDAPEMAVYAAETLVGLDSDQALAWAVIAYGKAHHGLLEESLSAITVAARLDPDSDFVQRTAGGIAAWYDSLAAPPDLPEALKTDMLAMRAAMAGRPAYLEAYAQAVAAARETEAGGQVIIESAPVTRIEQVITEVPVPYYVPYYDPYYYTYSYFDYPLFVGPRFISFGFVSTFGRCDFVFFGSGRKHFGRRGFHGRDEGSFRRHRTNRGDFGFSGRGGWPDRIGRGGDVERAPRVRGGAGEPRTDASPSVRPDRAPWVQNTPRSGQTRTPSVQATPSDAPRRGPFTTDRPRVSPEVGRRPQTGTDRPRTGLLTPPTRSQTPTTERPAVRPTTPMTGSRTPAVREAAPITRPATPAIRSPAPFTRSRTPTIRSAPPAATRGPAVRSAPPTQRTPSPIRQSSPAVTTPAPSVRSTPPPMRAPVVRSTPRAAPAVRSAPAIRRAPAVPSSRSVGNAPARAQPSVRARSRGPGLSGAPRVTGRPGAARASGARSAPQASRGGGRGGRGR